MSPSVMITSEALRESQGKHIQVLRAAGVEIHRTMAKGPLLGEPEMLAALAGCTAAMAANEPYTDSLLAQLPALRVIARTGVGYDSIDVAAATKRGVAVTITPDANYQAVAEHALALLLAVTRQIVKGANETRRGVWNRRSVFIPLRGKTLGIIGLGRIGRAVAARAKAFGLRLLVCETNPDQQFVAQHGIELVDLPTLFAQSDFVTVHAPLTPETTGLVNARTLGMMKKGSILINTARGGLVEETDLIKALESKHLAGAGLDVLLVEPPAPDHPLLAMDNVIVTAHVASLDAQGIEDMAVGAAQCIAEICQGRWPDACLVNPEVKSNWKGLG